MADQTEFIRKLCDEKNIDYKELLELIRTAIDDDGADIEYPAEPTINRWLNHQVKRIDPKFVKYVAIALGVSEDEIKLGKKVDTSVENLERIKQQLELDEYEKNKIARIIYLDKYHLRIFSLIFAVYGIFLLNLTLWKNPIVFLLTILLMVLALQFDKRRGTKESSQNKRSFIDEFRDTVETIKIIFSKGLFNRVLLLILILITALFLLPFVESLFYKGSLYISSTVLLLVAVVLFLESFTRR